MKKIIFLILILAISACSGDKKKNKVSGRDNISQTPNLNPIYPTTGGNSGTSFEALLQNNPCKNGMARITPPVLASTSFNNSNSRTSLRGPYNQNLLGGGNESSAYVGLSYFNDLIYITQVTNGSQVLGHNIRVSFCPYTSQYGAPLFVQGRDIRNFQSPNPIVLDQDRGCGIGLVDAAVSTTVDIGPFNLYNAASGIPTTFFKPTCNGSY